MTPRGNASCGASASPSPTATDVITHHDGDETYVLRDAATTDAELAAEKATFAEAMAGEWVSDAG